MAMLPPGDDTPPEVGELDNPIAYRAHVAEIMQRAHGLARSQQRKGDRFAIGSIVLAFLSSAGGFLTAVVDSAILGVIPGVLGAAGGSIASWVRRGHYDALASANRQLSVTLQHELREFDVRGGAYADVIELDDESNADRRFRLFVDRCEQASIEANASSESTRTIGT